MTILANASATDTDGTAAEWWRHAVVYQVYPRSFADSDGDGVGDIRGITAKLPYIASLGVDAIWINPWYPSPMKDAGYDVADYRAIEPVFGTMADAEELLTAAHAHGLRVLLDLVPNHTSDQHVWFQAALAAAPGSPERARYVFRDGLGDAGELPPNDWQSVFGGSGWHRITEPDGTPGQWYLHLFAPEQPDVNWHNTEVRDEFLDVLRFWFDRGVDGFRIDVAHSLAKDIDLPDVGELTWPLAEGAQSGSHPFWDRDDVHDIYRSWREVADSYEPQRVFTAEAWVKDPERLALYLRSDELQTAFNFDFLVAPWRAAPLRETIEATIEAHREVGAPATWVLSNHDVARVVSRFARDQHIGDIISSLDDIAAHAADFELGVRRARAAALLMLALPGSAYVYQGEELGLPEAEEIPADAKQDPSVEQGGMLGRDGCRVPLPWSGDAAPYGFGSAAAATWLPQPEGWAPYAVAAQDGVEGSTLELFRAALHLRRDLPALRSAPLTWLDLGADVLAFRRGDVLFVANLGTEPVALPEGAEVLLASAELTGGLLPVDAAVWAHG